MKSIQAIILKVSNYNDTQKIIRVFSRERGYMTLITPSYIIKNRKISGTVLQLIEAEYYDNEKTNFHKVKSISSLLNTHAIYMDIYKMNIALLWGEVLDILLRNEGPNEHLYTYLYNSIAYLNTATTGVANFNLSFLFRLATHIGYKINTDTYREGYIFNINDGIFIPTTTDLYITGPNTAKAIFELCSFPIDKLIEIKLNQSGRKILLDIIFLYYSLHVKVNFQVKSILVIREVFEG